MSKWIRKGDRVLVISGNSKGLHGEVLMKGKDRVIVQGVNLRKKCLRRTQQNQKGGVVEMEMPIHISNVSLCDKEGNRLKVSQNKKRELVYKAQGKEVVYRSIKKPA